MRKILITCCLILPLIVTGQKITLNAFDDPVSTTPIDQIVIGFDPNATLSIDSDLGEEDLTNQAIIGEFDLRVVQRDQESYDCMVDTAGNNLAYPQHLESKVDLRNPNNLDTRNSYFEIMPNGIFNGFILELEEYHTPQNRRGYLNLATKSNCEDEMFQFYLALPDPELNPIYIARVVITAFDVNWPPETPQADVPFFTKLYVHMEQDILSSTATNDEFEISKIAFPNPTSGNATIDWCGSAELISLSGQSLILDNSSDCTKYFDLNYLPAGAYFIKLTDEKNKYQMTLKLMKI